MPPGKRTFSADTAVVPLSLRCKSFASWAYQRLHPTKPIFNCWIRRVAKNLQPHRTDKAVWRSAPRIMHVPPAIKSACRQHRIGYGKLPKQYLFLNVSLDWILFGNLKIL